VGLSDYGRCAFGSGSPRFSHRVLRPESYNARLVSTRLAIFDFDGTLADSFGPMLEEFDHVAREQGLRPLERGALERYRGMDGRALMRELAVPAWKLPRLVAAMRRRLAARLSAVPLFEGAAACLEALDAAGVALAVVSSNSRENVEAVLGPVLASRVGHYACGAAMFGKARHFRWVLARSGVAAHEAVCIGDEVRDIEAAAAAGLAFVGVGWGYALPAALAARGVPVVTDFAQLRARLSSAA